MKKIAVVCALLVFGTLLTGCSQQHAVPPASVPPVSVGPASGQPTQPVQPTTPTQPAQPSTPRPEPVSTGTPAQLQQMTKNFYDWYLHERVSPLQSRTYRTRPELSATYVQWLDTFVADPAHQYDPIVQAQERPTHYKVGLAVVSAWESYAPISFEWADMISHDYVVFRPKDGVWQISNIAMVSQEPKATPTSAPAPAVPADQVVQGFYTWYLHHQGNPLVDHAYRSRSELSPAFIAWIDRFLNQSCDCGDPFLEAQNTPKSFQVGQPSVSGTVATVVVTFEWDKETSTINVKLVQAGDRWQIAGITRGEATAHSN